MRVDYPNIVSPRISAFLQGFLLQFDDVGKPFSGPVGLYVTALCCWNKFFVDVVVWLLDSSSPFLEDFQGFILIVLTFDPI